MLLVDIVGVILLSGSIHALVHAGVHSLLSSATLSHIRCCCCRLLWNENIVRIQAVVHFRTAVVTGHWVIKSVFHLLVPVLVEVNRRDSLAWTITIGSRTVTCTRELRKRNVPGGANHTAARLIYQIYIEVAKAIPACSIHVCWTNTCLANRSDLACLSQILIAEHNVLILIGLIIALSNDALVGVPTILLLLHQSTGNGLHTRGITAVGLEFLTLSPLIILRLFSILGVVVCYIHLVLCRLRSLWIYLWQEVAHYLLSWLVKGTSWAATSPTAIHAFLG